MHLDLLLVVCLVDIVFYYNQFWILSLCKMAWMNDYLWLFIARIANLDEIRKSQRKCCVFSDLDKYVLAKLACNKFYEFNTELV